MEGNDRRKGKTYNREPRREHRWIKGKGDAAERRTGTMEAGIAGKEPETAIIGSIKRGETI